MNVADSPRVRTVTELDPRDGSFDVTEPRTLRALRDAEDRHFWHRTRNELIGSRLGALGVLPGARVIELGCGGGCVTAHLSRAGYRVVGVDGHRELIALAADRAPHASFWVHDLSRGVAELPDGGFDAAGLFDVIEHLDDPRAALRDAWTLVRGGGWVVGTVPAMLRLWSRVDEQAGHRRRYEVSMLAEELRTLPGAERIEVRPFNRLLVPAMMVQRKLVSRLRDRGSVSEVNMGVPPRWLNRLAAVALRWEYRWSPAIDRLTDTGASLWFAARKPNDLPERVPRGGVEPPT